MWQNIIDKLKTLFGTITQIQEIYDYEVNKFNGDPALVIVPSGNAADYESTTENRRVYAFKVLAVVDRTTRADTEAERVLRSIVDKLLNVIDKNWSLSGLVLPAGYAMLFTEALPSVWGYIDRENIYRVAEITIRVHLDCDINLIT
jgi:hypothetical protein